MQLQHIEFGKLKISPANMRHGRRAPDASDILPSVKARGILQPLLVRPDGEEFEIVAGRRRYFCAKAVVEEEGEIAPLPCAIMEPGDDAAALEASLIENLARLDPDEMSQYECFARLVKEGKTPRRDKERWWRLSLRPTERFCANSGETCCRTEF